MNEIEMAAVEAEIAGKYSIGIGKSSPDAMERAVMYTPQQIREKVGDEMSVKINFVPQMLTALAMELATEFADHLRDYRVEDTKKETRIIRMAVGKYADRLYRSYGKTAYDAYNAYVKRFMSEVMSFVSLFRLKLSELVANQFPKIKDRQVPILACAVCGVISYIEWYDAEMDKELEARLGRSVKCQSNRHLDVIKAVCVVIAERKHCKIQIDAMVADWLNIMGNRATLLAERIFREENPK